MELIERDELKAKLDRGDDFKLVMVMGEWAYKAQHIPGSINVNRPEEAAFDKEAEIIVYCSGDPCMASMAAYTILVDTGYTNVRRYAGGLQDWTAAGYPIEGDLVI